MIKKIFTPNKEHKTPKRTGISAWGAQKTGNLLRLIRLTPKCWGNSLGRQQYMDLYYSWGNY